MILLIGMACLAMAGAVFWPDTGVGRLLRRALIEAPAAALSRKGLQKAGLGIAVAAGLLLILAAPELLAIVTVADIALYIEVIGLALLIGGVDWIKTAARAAAKTLRTAGIAVRILVQRPGRRSPAPPSRSRTPRRPRIEPDPGWAFA